MSWKTRKRQRGGATTAQSACPITSENYKDMALHAIMDMVHDHGSSVYDTVEPLVNGHRNKEEIGIGTYASEEQAREYFFSANPNSASIRLRALATLIPNIQERWEQRIEFLLNENTAFFRDDQLKGFVRFFFNTNITDNSTVGVVQDNGELIYNKIGGLNLLTFGSILDQAKKPKDVKSDPIYMNVGQQQLRINACEYGINKYSNQIASGIDYIQISGFKLVSNIPVVNCYFGLKKGANIEWIDAINPTRKYNAVEQYLLPNQNPSFGQNKIINVDEISKAGYFTSIAKIAEVEHNYPQYVSTPERKRLFYLGKFFGDTSLVASVSPQINLSPQPINNPFFDVNSARYIFPNNRGNPTLENVLLKTFDQLNYVRAVIKGRPVVYQQAKTLKNQMYFIYVPGENYNAGAKPVDINELKTKCIQTINGSMIPKINNTYQSLINNLQSLIVADKVTAQNFGVSNVHKNVLNTPEKQTFAARCVRQVIECLDFLRQQIVEKITQDANDLQNLNDDAKIKSTFKFIENTYPNYIPFATSIKPGNFTIFDVLILKQLKNEYIEINGEKIYGKLVLRFKETFETDPTNIEKLNNTALFHNFLNIITPLIPLDPLIPQVGGGNNNNNFSQDLKNSIKSIHNSVIKDNIRNTSKELVSYLTSNKTPNNDSIFFTLYSILHTQSKQFEKNILIYFDSLLDSYPNFLKYYTFLHHLYSKKFKYYKKIHPFFHYLICISKIFFCSSRINLIYDSVYFTIIRNEGINSFIELSQLNIDLDDISKIENYLIGYTLPQSQNLSKSDFIEKNTLPSRLSAILEVNETNDNTQSSYVASPTKTSSPLKGKTNRSSTLKSRGLSQDFNSSELTNSSKVRSSQVAFLPFNSTSKSPTQIDVPALPSSIRRPIPIRLPPPQRGSQRKTRKGGAKTMKSTRKQRQSKKNKKKQIVHVGGISMFKNISKEELNSITAADIFLNDFYKNYIKPLQTDLQAETEMNLLDIEYSYTVLSSFVKYNINTNQYDTIYEDDKSTIIAISLKSKVDSLRRQLQTSLNELNKSYIMTRKKFYLTL